MNIGQLMRGLMGDAKPADGKAVELKAGQIVRGVLVQMLDDQDALVQINGMQVRARLETPLPGGQSALLQVQPQTADGQIVLKQVGSGSGSPDEGVKEWMEGLGLPERKWAAALARDLRGEGTVPLREASKAMRQAAAEMPAGTDEESWMRAAAIALKRGLPMTAGTVGALRQAVFGAPAHELMQALERELDAWGGGGKGAAAPKAGEAAPPPAGAAQAIAAKLRALLAEGAALSRAAQGGAEPPAHAARPAAAGGGAGARAAAPAPGAAGEAAAPPAARSAAQAAAAAPGAAASGGASTPGNAGASGRAGTFGAADMPGISAAADEAGTPGRGAVQQGTAAMRGSDGGWIGQLMKWLGVDHERMLARSALAQPADANPLRTEPEAPTAAEEANNAAQSAQNGRPAEQPTASALARDGILAALERHSARLESGAAQSALSASAGDAQPPEARQGAAESLKSALLSLTAADEAPPALKEAAQQLIQHISGQQLLLAPERTGSPFTHVTMFVPFRNGDGEQTAAIHIQTRRGRKGELDAANCRLLFDLRMRNLGDTIVDVHVVDRIVSLNLWNDHPAVERLLEAYRDEAAEAMKEAGYQLSALKATPLPERTEAERGRARHRG